MGKLQQMIAFPWLTCKTSY